LNHRKENVMPIIILACLVLGAIQTIGVIGYIALQALGLL
jgi:hypothetical protein